MSADGADIRIYAGDQERPMTPTKQNHTAFIVQNESWGDSKVTEIGYKNRGKEMLTGVTKVRDVIGETFYISSRLSIEDTADTLEAALDKAAEHINRHMAELSATLAEIEACRKENR